MVGWFLVSETPAQRRWSILGEGHAVMLGGRYRIGARESALVSS